MELEIVYGHPRNRQVVIELSKQVSQSVDEGTMYLGYPVLATADDKVEIDALLVTPGHGLVAYRIADRIPENEGDWRELVREQDRLYNVLDSHLSRYESLRRGRSLALTIETITLFAADPGPVPFDSEATFGTLDDVGEHLSHLEPLSDVTHRSLQAALQRVTTIKPAKRRDHVKNSDSRGATMKVIEKGIANLDFWQKKAAIETPDAPQRIRGLAGSGKTIVLALKAALLHAQDPSLNIAVTFWSRALYQQFDDLVTRFSFAHLDDRPDPEKLTISHAWGSRTRDGLYSKMARTLGVEPRDFTSAEKEFGRDEAFDGVCKELLQIAEAKGAVEPIFDAVLIDEAQDLPVSFFRLVYLFTKEPKRIVWAYDELQKLDEGAMASTAELFGTTATGEAIVNIENREGEARRDIVLPVCYRNSPWSLATAHSIGFGVYRDGGLVQHFDDPKLWQDIGYQVNVGALSLGSYVELERASSSYPQYFTERLDSADAVVLRGDFPDEESQDRWVASEIARDLSEGELEHDDILVVLPSAYTSKRRYVRLSRILREADVPCHLVGVNNSRDEVFIKDSVAIAHIYRAKGNEAPMVYVVDAQYAGSVSDEVTRRNTIFTAITRSKAWVRVCGYGVRMAAIAEEVAKVRDAGFKLKFEIPTLPRLQEMRSVNADVKFAAEDDKALLTFEQLADALARDEISLDQLPPTLRTKLSTYFGQLEIDDGDS